MTPAEPRPALPADDRDAEGFAPSAATWTEVAALNIGYHLPDPPASEVRAR